MTFRKIFAVLLAAAGTVPAPAGCSGGAPQHDPSTGRLTEVTSASDGTDDADLDDDGAPANHANAEHGEPGFEPQGESAIGTTKGSFSGAKVFNYVVKPGLTIRVQSLPGADNVDLVAYGGSTKIGFSARPTGYVDHISAKNVGTAPATLTVVAWCVSAWQCAFDIEATVGNETTFVPRPHPYLNQLVVTAKTGACEGDGGAKVSDGYCRCAPSAAAMSLAGLGKIKATPEAMLQAADALFKTNNANGGANRGALMAKLQKDYSFTECKEIWDQGAARKEVLQGSFTLARGLFTSAGHYTDAFGFDGGSWAIDDPFGRYNGKGKAYTTNTATTNYGFDQRYDLNVADLSFIVCHSRPRSPCAGRASGDYCASSLDGYAGSHDDLVSCKGGEIAQTQACGACVTEKPGTSDHCQAAPKTSCSHSTCVLGGKLDAACHPTVASLCKADAYCCHEKWDSICVAAAKKQPCAG